MLIIIIMKYLPRYRWLFVDTKCVMCDDDNDNVLMIMWMNLILIKEKKKYEKKCSSNGSLHT